MARQRLRYQWDRARARYIDTATGRAVSGAQVRRALDQALRTEQNSARALALSYANRRITLQNLHASLREMVRNVHLYSAFIAKGGQAQMTPRDYGIVGQEVRVQYGFLDGLMDDLATGKQKLDGSFTNRVGQYAGQGRKTHHRIEREVMFAAGMTEERNILHPADHCGECKFLRDLGWVPIGTLPPIGTRECRANCRCTVAYRVGDERSAVRAQGAAETLRAQIARAPVTGTTLTDAEILARPSSAYVPARPGEFETINRYTTAGGQLTPERQQLHDAITRQHFLNTTPVADPTVYMMGGGPASGKSVMLAGLRTPSNAIDVDADHIKTLLPEFREGVASGDTRISTQVHEESSALAKEITAQAASGRYNIIIDGTGDSSYENLARKVAGWRVGGARVVANYITVDTDTAIERAAARGLKTGRNVPEDFIREVHRSVSNVVPEALRNGLFDEFTLWDNNGAAGAATKIARYADGRLTILNESLWQRFLDKAL